MFSLRPSAESSRCQNETPKPIDPRTWVLEYLPSLAQRVDPKTGVMQDAHETFRNERFAPSLAALLFERGYAWTQETRWLDLARLMRQRSLHAAEANHPGATPFNSLFLVYFAWLAHRNLLEHDDESTLRQLNDRFRRIQPSAPANLNGAAMGWAHRLNLDAADVFPVDAESMLAEMEPLNRQQSPCGFLNDNLTDPTCPIAYHLFTYVLLAQAVALRGHKNNAWKAPLRPVRDRLVDALQREQGWLLHFIAPDGSLATTGRTCNHFWTAGALIAYFRFRGLPMDHTLIQNHLRYWEHYRKPDGTFSLTPNHFANSYRVGFERYSVEQVYVSLGLGLLALAISDFTPARPVHRFDATKSPTDAGLFYDPDAGYAMYQSAGRAIAMSVQSQQPTNAGLYALPGSIFDACLANGPVRILAGPAIPVSVTKITSPPPVSVHEGLRATSLKRQQILPAPAAPMNLTESTNALTVEWEQPEFGATRLLRLEQDSLTSVWNLVALSNLRSFEVTLPLILDDGSGPRRIEPSGNVVTLELPDGDQYELIANAPWTVDSGISTESSHGIVRSLRLSYEPTRISLGQVARLGWRLRRKSDDHDTTVTYRPLPTAPADWLTDSNPPEWLRQHGDTFEYDVPPKEKLYLVSGGPLHNWQKVPESPYCDALRPGWLYALRIDAECVSANSRPNVDVTWLNYQRDCLSHQVTFTLHDGTNLLPVWADNSAPGYRVAFRLTGAGSLRILTISLAEICAFGTAHRHNGT